MRWVLVVLAALLMGGCVISTPDTADSGTGFRGEIKAPWECRPAAD